MVDKRNRREGFSFAPLNRAGIIDVFAVSLFFIFFFAALCLHSQELDIRFKKLTLEQGSRVRGVNCILQDRLGFMWFGTEDGLYRYDGYDFLPYRHDMEDPTSISSDRISCLLEDQNKILWIGTKGGGLDSFNLETLIFTHYRHNRDNISSLSNNDVSSICEDSGGILWVGTHGGGLNKFHRETGRFIRYSTVNGHLSHNDINCIYKDFSGALWVGTGGGLNKFIPEENRFRAYRHDPEKPNSLSSDDIRHIYQDSRKTLWIGTDMGLTKFAGKTGTFIRYNKGNSGLSHNEVTGIIEDWNEVLWVGTKGGGLNRMIQNDRGEEEFIGFIHDPANPYSLGDNDIRSLYEDRSEILWIGTSGGTFRYSRKWNTFKRYRHINAGANSPGHNNVTAIYEDGFGTLWAGTAGGGLNRLDRQTGQFSPYTVAASGSDSLNNNHVYALCEGPEGILWIGTGGGLNMLDDLHNGRLTVYDHSPAAAKSLSHNDVRCMFYEERSGDLWLGTKGGGLNRFAPQSGRFREFRHNPQNSNSLCHDDVRCIAGDSRDLLWIGTHGGGLDRLNTKTLRFEHYTTRNSGLSSNYINCFHQDKYGILWIGTDEGGLNKFTPANKKFRAYREKDGLPGDSICGILEDEEGCLWISTGKGFCRFAPQTETFKSFGVDEGLLNDSFNSGAACKSRSGDMFFGGKEGVDSFSPAQIEDDIVEPKIVITGFLLANNPVSLRRIAPASPLSIPVYAAQQITLSYYQNTFSFEFAALHYAEPRRNKYKYILEGYNRQWSPTDWKNRRAIYTNIPSGDYTFRVTGSNDEGVWNNEGASLKIKILPPPWKTWWAYSLYSMAFMGILYLIWSTFYKTKLEKELDRKRRDLENAQGQLVHSEKMASLGTLVAGVAHEINNPAGFIQLSASNLHEDLEEFKEDLVKLTGLTINDKILATFEKRFGVLFKHTGYINEGTTRIAKIVKDLRTFYRQDKEEIQHFRPIQGLSSTLNLVKAKYKDDVAFVTNFQSDPEIAGYPAELNQVFMNIIINACQAIRERKEKEKKGRNWQGKLTIQVQKESKYIKIKFRDEGTGMSKKVLKKIFDPFFTTKPEGQGTGIGLFITYDIVRKHKGQMKIDSEEGQGTAITLCLPLKKEGKPQIKER